MKLTSFRIFSLAALAFMPVTWPVFAQDSDTEQTEKQNIDISADSLESLENNTGVVGKGNVVVTYGDIVLNADEVALNNKTGEFDAKGNVNLTSGLNRWMGPSVKGNFRHKSFETENCRAQYGPFFIQAEKASKLPTEKPESDQFTETVITNAFGSKDGYVNPSDSSVVLHASTVNMTKDGFWSAYNAVFKAHDIPFFYLPVVWSDGRTDGAVSIDVGYRGRWGAFMIISKKDQLSENLTNTVSVGLRSKNGISLGNKTEYKTDNSVTSLELFGIKDNDAPTTNDPLVNPVGEDYNKRFDFEDERYRAKFTNRTDFTENLTLRVNMDKLSDIDMLEDWYEDDFDNERQPKSEASLIYFRDNYEIFLKARPRLNDFYNTVERMPELQLNTFNTEIGDSGIFYESHSSIAEMEMKWSEKDLARIGGLEDPKDYETTRFDTMHTLTMPMRYDNWLNIIPRAGMRLTYYSDSSERDVTSKDLNNNFDVANPDNVSGNSPIANYDDLGGDIWRLTGELGLELTFKKYKTWSNYYSEKYKLDGLRHVVEPYVNFTSVLNPTEAKENIYYFDEVDRIDELNFVRVGARQRLQTRRNRQIYTFAEVETYADFHATKRDEMDNLGDLGAKATFRPHQNLSAWTRVLVGMDSADLNECEVGLTYGKPGDYVTTISYLYRNNYQHTPAYSMNSHLSNFSSSSYFDQEFANSQTLRWMVGFPINEKTYGDVTFSYDFARGKLIESMFRMRRDMGFWDMALGLGMDDEEFKVMLNIYLKSLPDFKADTLKVTDKI